MKIEKKELFFAIIAILLGVLTRTIFDLGQNVELVTAFALVCGFFFKNKRYAYVVTLVTMIVSDLFLKNTNIFLFTWSGFLIAPLLGSYLRVGLRKLKITNLAYSALGAQLIGIISTIVFFLWTNFGVWLIGDMYVKDLSGLILSYINAIPFVINQLVGNLFFVPIVFIVGAFVFEYNKSMNPIVNKIIEQKI